VSFCASDSNDGSSNGRQPHSAGTANQQHQRLTQRQLLLQQSQEVYAPCPLMNPFLVPSSTCSQDIQGNGAADAAWALSPPDNTDPATQAGSTAHRAGSSSSNHYSAVECSKSHPSSYTTARSASRGSISGSEHDNNRSSSSSSCCKSQQAAAAAAAARASAAVAAAAAPAASPPRVFQSRQAAWRAGTRVGLGPAALAAAPDGSAASCSRTQKRGTARQAGSSNAPGSSSADRQQQLGSNDAGAANIPQNGTPQNSTSSCLASSSTAQCAASAGANTADAGAQDAVIGTDTAAKSSELERPSSSSSDRSQKAASVAAAAASALTQAAMHLDRVTLSERVMQQQRQQHALEQQQLTATAARDRCSGPAAAQAAGASEAKPPAGLLPGLSEIEPAEAEAAQATSGQEQEHQAHTAAADGRTLCAPHHRPEPSFAQGLTDVEDQHQVGTEAGAAVEASWLDDFEREMGMGHPNPFLDSDNDTQRPSTAAPAARSPHASTARPQTAAPACGTSDGPQPWGSMAPPASEAGAGGPLTASRSQLLRQSRTFGGKPVLSSPATTAAAAARLTGKKHSGSGRTWDDLPGAVAAASYAATASLRTNPLPALAAVAAGQQKRAHAVDPEPGVLTLKASQLPQRAASESGFSTRSSYSRRHPGLRAEESTATAAVAMQQLARQQVSNQELICRLLQAPGAAVGAAVAEPNHMLGQGFPACSVAQGSTGLLQPELSGVSSVLAPSTSVFVLQQQPMHAQYNSNSASFLGPVAVEDLGRSAVHVSTVQLPPAGATQTVLLQRHQQQQQQRQPQLLLLRSDSAAAAPSRLVQIPAGTLQYSEPLPQLSGVLQQPQQQLQLQQQQAWHLQQPGSIGARAAHASGPQQTGFTSLLLQPQHHHQAHGLAVPVTLQHSPFSGSVTVIPAGPADASAAVINGGVHQVLQPYDHECFLQQQRSSVSVASSAAGSVLAGLTGTRSCLELGSRSGDLNVLHNIVQRAKAKAAAAVARKHQQSSQQQQQQQEEDSTPKTPVLGSRLLDMLAEGKQLKGAAAMLVGKPRQAVYPAPTAQSTAAVSAAHGIPASVPSGHSGAARGAANKPSDSNEPEAAGLDGASDRHDPGTGGSLTAAVRDGDRVLKMLQEYKELSELDKAVKSRMMQLLHTASVSGATAAGGSAAAAAAARAELAGQADAAADAAATVRSLPASAAGAAGADVLLRGYGGAGHTANRSSSARLPVLSEASNEQQDVPGGPSSSLLQQPQPGNNCAGVTEPAYGYANPFLEQSWPETAGAGAAAAVSVDAPGSRYSFVDQAQARLLQHQQHRSSPSKARQQHTLQHVDQQLKLQGSPNRLLVRNPAGNTSNAVWDAQGPTAAKHKAARQLWERRQTAKAAAAAQDAGAATAAAADIGRWVHAPDTHPAAVAALVAAVAGGQATEGAGAGCIAAHGRG